MTRWIPFGDHPSTQERYREDWHGPCARMTRTTAGGVSNLLVHLRIDVKTRPRSLKPETNAPSMSTPECYSPPSPGAEALCYEVHGIEKQQEQPRDTSKQQKQQENTQNTKTRQTKTHGVEQKTYEPPKGVPGTGSATCRCNCDLGNHDKVMIMQSIMNKIMIMFTIIETKK